MTSVQVLLCSPDLQNSQQQSPCLVAMETSSHCSSRLVSSALAKFINTHITCQHLACHAFACNFCLWLLQDLNFQGDGFDRNQTRLTRERQRLSAWRGKVAGLETALENLAGQFENAPQPSGSATSPALKQKYLSRLFHKVCTKTIDMYSSLRICVAVSHGDPFASGRGHRTCPGFGQLLLHCKPC